MGALVGWLAHAGSRKSDGSANAAGKVWAYQAGSTSTVTPVYRDAACTNPWTQPILLDSVGKAKVFTKTQVKLRVEDSTGAAVDAPATTDVDNTLPANLLDVANAGFTGVLASGSQGASGQTDMDTVLSRAAAAWGGLDWQYRESAGAVGCNPKDWMRSVHIDVKNDYGAKGDGSTDDTAAIQAAMSRVKTLGGGIVYLPAGTYVVSQALTLSSAPGVTIMGAGSAATIIQSNNAGADLLTFTLCNGLNVRGLRLSHAATSSGRGLAVLGCTVGRIDQLYVDAAWKQGLDLQSNGGYLVDMMVTGSVLQSQGANSAAARLGHGTTGAVGGVQFVGNTFLGGAADLALGGDAGDVAIIGNFFSSTLSTYNILLGDGSTAAIVTTSADFAKRFTAVGNTFASNSPLAIAILPTGSRMFAEAGNTSPVFPQRTDNADDTSWQSDMWGSTASDPGDAVLTPDLSKGDTFLWTLAGTNRQLNNPIKPGSAGWARGRSFKVILTQGGAGAPTYDTAYKAASLSPALGGSGKTSTVTFVYDGTNWRPSAVAVSTT